MEPGRLDTDVIIAGGGPARAATAIAYAQHGLRVRLFERAAFSGHGPGETLHRVIERLLQQFGLSEQFQSTVSARHSGIWLSWGGRKQFRPTAPTRTAHPRDSRSHGPGSTSSCSIMRMSKAWRYASPAR